MDLDSEKLILETSTLGEIRASSIRQPPVMRDESDHRQELRDHEVTMGRLSNSSEVVVLDERIREAVTSAPAPTIANITQSTRVHIGPKIDFITQNVTHTEVVKGRIVGLELISPQKTNWLRCSIAVFVCWSIVVVCALIFLTLSFALAKKEARLDLDLNETWYLRRGGWLAMPEYKIELLELPVSYVLIGHSALEHCTEKYACIKHLQEIQKDHLRRGWNDIGPNFLVGGDALIFEGRGANLLGAMVTTWNRVGVSFMFLGDYRFAKATEEQYDHIQIVIDQLVKQGVLKPDYIVYGHCQMKGGVIAPGPNIMDTLHHLPHWKPDNLTSCVRS